MAQASRGFAGDAICSELKEFPSGLTGVELRYDQGITVTQDRIAREGAAREGTARERGAGRQLVHA